MEEDTGRTGGSSEYLAAIDSMGTVVFADRELLEAFGRPPLEGGALSVADLLGESEVAWLARAAGRLFAGVPGDGALAVWTARAGGGARFFVALARVDRPDGRVFVAATLSRAAS